MAAAASAAAAVAATHFVEPIVFEDGRRSSFSLHLRDEVQSHANEDPIDIITRKAKLDSKEEGMKKLSSTDEWQRRRLILTERRIYVLFPGIDEEDFEIVDSIPLHEIVSCLSDHPTKLSTKTVADPPTVLRTESSQLESFVAKGSAKGEEGSDAQDSGTEFYIVTKDDGFNQGLTLGFSAETTTMRDEWIAKIRELSKKAKVDFQWRNKVETYQVFAQGIFHSKLFQACVVSAIVANFIITLVEAERGPQGVNYCPNGTSYVNGTQTDPLVYTYEEIDTIFTSIFLAELIFNFSAHAVVPFFRSRWNWFDCIIIFISFAFIFVPGRGDMIKVIRIIRVFRILRVFGRIGELREIVNAITVAIIPALQALLIGLIVVAIYAAIGTEYFADENQEGFCDFFHSFYNMFSVVAFSNDPGLKLFDNSGVVRSGHVAFVYSYICIVVFVLIQIVVAVLLDGFYRARQLDKLQAAREAAAKLRIGPGGSSARPMEGLMERLAADFSCGEDLERRVLRLFHEMDTDRTGTISYSELSSWLYKDSRTRPTHEFFNTDFLAFDHVNAKTPADDPPRADLLFAPAADTASLSVTRSTVDSVAPTKRRASVVRLLTGNIPATEGDAVAARRREQELDRGDFHRALVRQVRRYVQRRMAEVLHVGNLRGDEIARLRALKLVVVQVEGLQRTLGRLQGEIQRRNEVLDQEAERQGERLKKILEVVSPEALQQRLGVWDA